MPKVKPFDTHFNISSKKKLMKLSTFNPECNKSVSSTCGSIIWMKSSDLYGENVAFNASISDGLQTFNTYLVEPNESDDPWTNLKLYLIFNCPSVAGFHDVAADQVYVKKSSSHDDVKTDMTPAYAAAMDPGGKFIMVTSSKIAMILLIVKTKKFRENDESHDANLFDTRILPQGDLYSIPTP